MIAIGCDHGGYDLKLEIIKYLEREGIAYKDFGCNGESVDYPIYARKVGQAVLDGECEKGILICGTGIGISIAANKMKGIRCALCSDCFSAAMRAPAKFYNYCLCQTRKSSSFFPVPCPHPPGSRGHRETALLSGVHSASHGNRRRYR